MINYRWLLILGLIIISCKQDLKLTNKDKIVGKWNLSEGYRNGNLSKTMDNTWFNFNSDSTMASNLFEGQKLNYTINEKILSQKGFKSINYDIVKLHNDTLILKAKIGRYRYILNLMKSIKKK